MEDAMFSCIQVDKSADDYRVKLVEIEESSLPEGDVTIDIAYSSLNYKDALAITGKSPVIRKYPMVPGIDLAGTIVASTHPEYPIGMPVLVNGWGIGEVHWGGLAQKARLSSDWLVPIPQGLDVKQAMAIGTAGYTAMLTILALERNGVTPDKGEILVTGAAGGVGGIALSILSNLGYQVVAMVNREADSEYVKCLGAVEVLHGSEYSQAGKPLARERWAGVVDVVGSQVLVNACASTKYGGIVTACGLAGGMDFPATVAPFILRGITLIGIDSVRCPFETRMQAWHRLTRDYDLSRLGEMTQVIGLADVLESAGQLLSGESCGRFIVDVNH
jgi:acrylyl-CoA reductase (NADPH)